MRLLLSTSAFGAIAAVLAGSASAQTIISTATTAPVQTSTTGDLQISTTGSIKPTSGVAVTINSNADVKNAGAIGITGSNGSTGIFANTNLAGDITNSGTITIDENYTPTDGDNDGDLDGPFATGNGRFGIRIAPGGTFTGNVLNSGTITVEGNQSAGIAIDSALAGSLTNSGTVSVRGNDSFGIRTSAVSGNVTVGNGSNVVTSGLNSVGVLLGGNVGGAFVIQGNVTSTGYRSTTAPADVSKLDADDLLQGGSAVVVAGNVAGGILLDAKPADLDANDSDEDDDGIPDANETTASVTSYGSAPALKIGSATQSVTIGAVGSGPYGLVVKGAVAGLGVYTGADATGISIGGTGQSVSLAGGMAVSGTVRARAVGADATAIHIASGASVPAINVSGTVAADTSGGAGTVAQAILIDSGATVNSILNSGSIAAALTGTQGTATAILDKSGSVSLVENKGSIGAGGVSGTGTAIDLSANTIGAQVRQVAAASGKPAPTILGDILLGSGNDTVAILAGSVIGDIDFGGGSDTLGVSGTFRGELLDSAGAAVIVGSGGLLDVKTLGTVDIASLTAGANSTIGVTIGSTGHTLYNVAGEASFGANTTIAVTVDKIATAAGTYTVVDAGTLTGAGNLTSSVVTLPFLFSSSLATSAATGQVLLDIEVKGSDELGLNRSEAAIIDAALAAVDADTPIAAIFLGAGDSESLKDTLQQLMPDHSGGAFETVSRGTRLAGDMFADPRSMDSNEMGLWMHQFGWSTNKPVGETANFRVSGWGATAGIERRLGALGHVGVTAAYMAGRDSKNDNDLASTNVHGGVYWRGGVGPLRGFARAAVGTVKFEGTREFRSELNGVTVSRTAEGEWNGRTYSAAAGISYEIRSGRLSIRPSASIDHIKLHEKGYEEQGGGDAFDLTVHSRNSSETGANALLAVGYDLWGTADPDGGWFRIEAQGGRRQILGGSLGKTTASFEGGDDFTLSAEERTSGLRGALRLLGGSSSMSFAAEIGAEEVQGRTGLNGRIGIGLAL